MGWSMAAIDVTSVVAQVGMQFAPILAVGGAALLVFVALKSFVWIKLGLGAVVDPDADVKHGRAKNGNEVQARATAEARLTARTKFEQIAFETMEQAGQGRVQALVDRGMAFGDAVRAVEMRDVAVERAEAQRVLDKENRKGQEFANAGISAQQLDDFEASYRDMWADQSGGRV